MIAPRNCLFAVFCCCGQVVKDILRDAFEPENAPRRRIGSHVSGWQLLEAARARPHSWAKAVSYAKAKAALLRGGEDTTGWEQNPFKWDVHGWMSQAQVAFVWEWYEAGIRKSEIVEESALNLLVHDRLVPRPPSLRNRPEDLQAKLEGIAAQHALCKYLGERQGDSYEPDPLKWTVPGTQEAVVWFEWQYVTRRTGKPHRVPVRLNDAFKSQRRVPGNPLSNAAPSLTFSLEYLQKFIEQKIPGGTYEGFAFDMERPSLEQGLPNGGHNIQQLPLMWALPPDGRSLHASLMGFNQLKAFKAPPPGSDEALAHFACFL